MLIRLLVSGILLLPAVKPAATKPLCTVTDPTGTPLNIRLEPNGIILKTLTNGATVAVLSNTVVEGKRWAYIGVPPSFLPAGWVFEKYLNCHST
jgi:hypothetical protein